MFLTREETVLSRNDNEIEKRKRVEDSDESLKPSKARTMDKLTAYTSDTSNENTSEINVAPVGVLARQKRTIQAVTSRKTWEREASLLALPNLL